MTFTDNPEAMTNAILISELGVGLPIFIFAPVIAMRFGQYKGADSQTEQIILNYFKSPVFIALIAGIIISNFHPDFNSYYLNPFKSLSEIMNNGLGMLSCLVLGIYLKPKSLKGILLLIILSALIQMCLQPLITAGLADLFRVSDIIFNRII